MAKFNVNSSDFQKEGVKVNAADYLKNELETLRVDLEWEGLDLDVCAFMLDEDGELGSEDDVVCFKSEVRWKTTRPFHDPNFNPLEGEKSTWEKDGEKFGGRIKKWKNETLPLSPDTSVIGSWDDGGDNCDVCGETMHVRLEEINSIKYKRIVFAAVVAEHLISEGITFKDIKNANVKITDCDQPETSIVEYSLTKEYPNEMSVCFGELVFDKSRLDWTFKPMSEAYRGGIVYLIQKVF